MRPVAAPDHAIRRHLDDAVGEGRDVAVGRARLGESIGAADLDPDVVAAREFEQRAERLLADAQRRIDAPDVVDHDRRGDRGQPVPQARQRACIEVQLDKPAQALDAAEHMVEHGQVQRPAMLGIECEAHAARALLMQPLAAGAGGRGIEPHDREVPPARARDGVKVHRVVESVGVGVDHQPAGDAELVMHPHAGVQRRVRRRVLAGRRIRKLRLRAEHMEVRVPRAGRQGPARPGRRRDRPQAVPEGLVRGQFRRRRRTASRRCRAGRHRTQTPASRRLRRATAVR